MGKTKRLIGCILTSVMTLQMWTSAASPMMDTLTRCCLAALMLSSTLPGSQVDSPANRISTCANRIYSYWRSALYDSMRNYGKSMFTAAASIGSRLCHAILYCFEYALHLAEACWNIAQQIRRNMLSTMHCIHTCHTMHGAMPFVDCAKVLYS